MQSLRGALGTALFLGTAVFAAAAVSPGAPSPADYSGLHWRSIGPFRGGWATCITGIPDRSNVFYFGAAVGGVWRTDDAGETWTPLFQHESTGSVDAIAVAPSNPDILYVGTGQVETRYDMAAGDGAYRSDDAGKTWRHAGLEATRAIGRIVIDPKNPDVVLAAAAGHIFGPSADRGVYRTEDGGKSWKKTLFVDENTGAVDLATDPRHPEVVYAATWQARNYPWLSYFQPNIGPGSGVYRSEDGGKTWKKATGNGWPTIPVGRVGLTVGSDGRVYAAVDARATSGNAGLAPGTRTQTGLYRTDDGGASWTRVNAETWVGSDYFGRLAVDPQNPDVVYTTGQSIRRSTDGGKTFEVFKGAPGGDDYHFVWVNPKNPDHIATGSDQGAVVSVNGGKSWSSWYNQPTGQFYHLAADDRFPYWIYSGQQDSGTAGVASRSDYGALSFREWHPVGGDERDYDVPDPGDPETVYVTGLGGNTGRFDGRTGQVAAIDPNVESAYARRATTVKYRYTWFTPIAVSPRPPHAIFQGAQVLFKSNDRGQSWSIVSPDLSRAVPGTPGCNGAISIENAAPCGFGVIYAIALSPKTDDDIWIGTDDGRIVRTRDGGKNWTDVTPKTIGPWSKVASLDLPDDPETAYAAVDRHRLDDYGPHAYRTHDGGRTWTAITEGLPARGFVDVVRADPARRGLLYAGTENGVWVSFDDGARWQPLQNDLPTTWVGDLLVHGDDLIAATQGRAIWILDDVAPLREIASESQRSGLRLGKPADAWRLRRNEYRDTPLPPETPLGENPPAGAIIDYWVPTGLPARELTIEILDGEGKTIRRFSSGERPEKPSANRYFAAGWLKPSEPLSIAAGHHRIVWDLREPAPKAPDYEYTIAAIWGEDTPAEPEGPLVPPGTYSVRLTAGAATRTQPLLVKMDPRVQVPAGAMEKQYALAREAAAAMGRAATAVAELGAWQKRQNPSGPPPEKSAAEAIAPFSGAGGFGRIAARLSFAYRAVEAADAAPTAQAEQELRSAEKDLDALLAKWKEFSAAK